MPDRSAQRADLVTSAVLFALGLAVIFESWRMPRFELRNINPWTVPGIVPGLLGLVLAILALAVLIRSIRALRRPTDPAAAAVEDTGLDDGSRWRLLVTLLLCLGYPVVLIGSLPFGVATALFIAAFIVIFEWSTTDDPGRRARKIAAAVAIGGIAGTVIHLAFRHIFLVRLP